MDNKLKLVRKAQLRKWLVSHATPPKEKSFFSQLLTPEMSFGERVARRLERDYGMGDGYLDEADAFVAIGSKAASDDIEIPQYDAGGGMGIGRLLLEGQPGVIKNWHVDHEWINQNVQNHTGIENLCIVTGFGPSMRPMFNPGDPLLVDRGVTTCELDAIYFFRIGKHGFIKMLQRIPKGQDMILRAKSKNPDYDPFDIDDSMDFQVLGRVLTIWKASNLNTLRLV